MKSYIYIIIGVLWATAAHGATPGGAVDYNRQDSIAITTMLRKADATKATAGGLALMFTRQLLGRPYVGHTLDGQPDGERLVVNTRQLDCTTLVETVTALTLCARRGQTTFGDYCSMLRQLRYRQGVLNGYNSRLHYFSDWIIDKQSMRLVKEVQQEQYPFTAVQELRVDFMSTHPQSYAALRLHPELVQETRRHEARLSGRTFRYVPKEVVKDERALRRVVGNGDIIAITTSKKGLDIAHVGFAVWQDGHLHLLHASQQHKKVVVDAMTLGDYLARHPAHTGIRIVSINDK